MLEYLAMLLAMSVAIVAIYHLFRDYVPARPRIIYIAVGISFVLGATLPAAVTSLTPGGVLSVFFGLIVIFAAVLTFAESRFILASAASAKRAEQEPLPAEQPGAELPDEPQMNTTKTELYTAGPSFAEAIQAATSAAGVTPSEGEAIYSSVDTQDEEPEYAGTGQEGLPAYSEEWPGLNKTPPGEVYPTAEDKQENEEYSTRTDLSPGIDLVAPPAGDELTSKLIGEILSLEGDQPFKVELFSNEKMQIIEEPLVEKGSFEKTVANEVSQVDEALTRSEGDGLDFSDAEDMFASLELSQTSAEAPGEITAEELPAGEEPFLQEDILPLENDLAPETGLKKEEQAGEEAFLPNYGDEPGETAKDALQALVEAADDAAVADASQAAEEPALRLDTGRSFEEDTGLYGSPLEETDHISAGFEAKAKGDMAVAAGYFFIALQQNRGSDITAALALEISSIYQELGQYLQAGMILQSVMEQEDVVYDSFTLQKLQGQLIWLETLDKLLKSVNMQNAPYSKIPNIIKIKADLETTNKLIRINQRGHGK